MSPDRKPRLRTWFAGTIVTRTALHVGTGSTLNPATDAPLLRGADGRPLIPGSSLKGAMRAASERLLRALGHRACMVFGQDEPERKQDRNAGSEDRSTREERASREERQAARADRASREERQAARADRASREERQAGRPEHASREKPTAGGPESVQEALEADGDLLRCLTTAGRETSKLFATLKRGVQLDEEQLRRAFELWGLTADDCRDFGKMESLQVQVLETGIDSRQPALCLSCLTWGSQFMAGRVRVPDLRIVDDDWADVTEIRDGVGLDRDTGTAAERIKFDLEALPAGARFGFEMVVEPGANLVVPALAVGELLQGSLPLGGRVTRGLGDVELTDFQILEVDLSDPAQLVPYLVRGQRRCYEKEAARNRLDEILVSFMEESRDVAQAR